MFFQEGLIKEGNSDYREKTSGADIKSRILIPGCVSKSVFDLLVELSSIHSKKIINALHDYLVLGVDRKIACGRYGASISYFSIALGRIFHTNQIVSQLIYYYQD